MTISFIRPHELITRWAVFFSALIVLTVLGQPSAMARCAVQTEIPSAECDTLVALYNSTDGPNWNDSPDNQWVITNTPCSWKGITCESGHVTKIERYSANLTGHLPDLSALTNLREIYLSHNQLTGPIPDWISALTNLQVLVLYDNQMTGPIPDLSALTNLLALSLGTNQLTGPIPDLSALTNLQWLVLFDNQLTGPIPDLSTLTDLLEISLYNNQLTGPIPDLSALTNLEVLLLFNNQLTGPIPDLSALTNLQRLVLSGNQLTGLIPDLSALTNLSLLRLDSNQLSGEIPPSLAQLNNLSELDLGYNQLTASDSTVITFLNTHDPDWADTQTEPTTPVTTINCATQTEIPAAECETLLTIYNSTDGPNWSDNADNQWVITNTPCSWAGVTCEGGHVTKIDREDKNLNGHLPDLSALTNLVEIALYNNQLTGPIPDLSALTNLQGLNLGSNQLTGPIPDLTALTNLQGLVLYDNQLTGAIPNLSALTNLQGLNLGSNQLTGPIPDLSALTNLQWLDLANNQLTGPIPNLSALTNLREFDLSHNQLTGPIPDLSALTNLQWLVLYDNQLTGPIPELSALTNLQGLNLSHNQLTGPIPALSALTNLQGLDLSHNQLTGPIPDLSALTNLQGLDLSHNQLTGPIPDLSALTNLSALRLESNQLSGEIPSSLAQLSNLSELDLGYNQLTASDSAVITFLNTHDPDWADTQTPIAPIANLTLTPTEVQSTVGQSWPLTAEGGSGQFFWAATGGELQTDGNTATYTATEAGVFYIWVSDGERFAWALVEATALEDALVLLRVVPNTLNLSRGETQGLSVRGYRIDGTSVDLTTEARLHCENTQIAQVTHNGMVTARTKGQTTLTAHYQDMQAQIPITVIEQTQVLKVVPNLIILHQGTTTSEAVKVYSVNQTGEESVFSTAQLTIRDPAIASINNNKVTGLQTGSTWLDVTAGETILPIPIVVRFQPQLHITPAYPTTKIGQPITFSVTGGQPPYQLTSNQPVRWTETDTFVYQSESAGTTTLTLTDHLGNQATAEVNVVGPLTVTPEQATVKRGETLTLQAQGAPESRYVWSVTQGDLNTNTGNTVQYTAPESLGRHTVTVRDGLGNSQDILVLVGDELSISPQQLFLAPGDQTELLALGGVPPYNVTATAGQADLHTNRINYTAPNVAGTYTVTVTDNTGQKISATVTVALDLLITPTAGRLDAGEQLKLQAAGGFGNKRWLASKGTNQGSFDKTEGDSVNWTAPAHFGTTFLHVIDAAGTTATATLEIASKGFAITPAVRHLLPSKTAEFTAVGGGLPYTCTTSAGDCVVTDETISYTAPTVKGHYQITVQDVTGKTAQAQANVYSTRLLASPKTLYIRRGETLKIAVGGGTGTYTLGTQLGHLEHTQLTVAENEVRAITQYTAPSNYGVHDTIEILDTAGNLATISVEMAHDEIINAYMGPDGILEEQEMGQAVKDYFTKRFQLLDKTLLYEMAEQFLQSSD
jgi:Leucine-rich repeat (LRR) protein